MSHDDKDENPIQKDSDEKFNAITKAEKEGTVDKNSDSKNNSDDSSGVDNVRNAEKGPDNSWEYNSTDADNDHGSKKLSGRFSFVKRKGPLTAIIITIFGGALGITSISGPALLTHSIYANFIQKFNTQDTSIAIRANKLIAAKMTQSVTSGPCVITKIACRYLRPSGRFLKQLEKNGIVAVDSAGNEIDNKILWPNTRIAKLRFTDSSGRKIEVRAADLYKTLTDSANKEFQAAFHLAQQTRFISVTDYVFNAIKTKFGFGVDDPLKAGTTDERLNATIDENVGVDDQGAKAASESEEASASLLKKLLGDKAYEFIQKIGTSGKGDAVGIVAGVVCLVGDAPGLVIKVERAYQMIQLIKYGSLFLSAFGAIKAGDATPEMATTIGNALTKVVKGRSAMDSFGMKYTLTGQTTPQNDNYKTYAPGMSMIALLGGVAAVTSSRAKLKACNILANPVTGAVINVTLAELGPETGGTAWFALIANFAIGYVLSWLSTTLGPYLVNMVMGIIPSGIFQSIMRFFWGDLTQKLSGEKVGDALTSGAAHVMGQTSNAGGNMPLSVDQAVAYEGVTKQVQLANAEEDRATKSPFDASSPNTFMGSLVQRLIPLIPYSVNLSSIAGSFSDVLSSMGKIVMGSFGMTLQPSGAGAADPSAQYKLCEDPEIKAGDIAAGPFCNIIYGIPTEYLNKDPVTIVNDLVDKNADGSDNTGPSAGNVDSLTGDPIPGKDLAKWITLCTDGTTDEAANCMLSAKNVHDSPEIVDFALYTIDHRIQKGMDEPGNVPTNGD